jgi:regulator of sigma E protease
MFSMFTQMSPQALLLMVPGFLFVLTIVVFFHELGHFLVARWNGVKVDVFSIGFGRELWGFNDRRGTRWKLAAVPLGGYVKFHGDADASSAPDFERARSMDPGERAVSFMHKRVWQRAAIVAAGPIANFILAIFIFAATFMFVGMPVSDPVVSSVTPGGAAEAAGFQAGDKIISISGVKVRSFTDVPRIVAPNPGRELIFVVERDGSTIEIAVTPRMEERTDRFGNRHDIGFVGLTNDSKAANFRQVKLGPFDAVAEGVSETWFIITRTLGYLRDIVIGVQSADQLGGPLRIAKVSGDVATLGVGALVQLVAVLSVSIGLLNLFPIPVLDGGHLVFYAIEALRGRPLSEKTQDMAFRIGFSLLLALMVFATWNDIT